MNALSQIVNEEGTSQLQSKERVLCGAAGVVLLIMGLRNLKGKQTRAYTELIAGAYLLFKGISGHAPFRTLQEKQGEAIVQPELDITV